MSLYEDVDIISFIRLSKLRWIGVVNRMDKERKVYNIFYNQPQGTNTFKYHVFAPIGRFQLELIYLYFPPSFHLTIVFSVL